MKAWALAGNVAFTSVWLLACDWNGGQSGGITAAGGELDDPEDILEAVLDDDAGPEPVGYRLRFPWPD